MTELNLYERHILPHIVDTICGMPAFENQRKRLVPRAQGQILEIGMGTGRNIPHYHGPSVDCVCGVDPGLHPKATARARAHKLEVKEVPLSAERIPVDDHSFDTVVCTFSLCTIPDPAAALSEMRRALKPGGVLLFAEHGVSPDENVRNWQDRITPYWKKIAGGCHLNRSIDQLIGNAGFEIEDCWRGYVKGPRFLSYFYSGSAVAPT